MLTLVHTQQKNIKNLLGVIAVVTSMSPLSYRATHLTLNTSEDIRSKSFTTLLVCTQVSGTYVLSTWLGAVCELRPSISIVRLCFSVALLQRHLKLYVVFVSIFKLVFFTPSKKKMGVSKSAKYLGS